jgi:GNAT superfamily N-acetyltransferase
MKKTFIYQTKIFSRIPPILRDSVDKLLQTSFPWAFEHATSEHKDRFCSRKDIFCHIVALERNIPIGYAAGLKRSIIYEGRSILLGGVGGMCVTPNRRNRGIGKRILDQTMRELQRIHCDVAYLCTNVNESWMVKFYGTVGFVPLGRSHTYVGKTGKRYTDCDAMIAQINSQAKFQFVLHEKSAFDIGKGNW